LRLFSVCSSEQRVMEVQDMSPNKEVKRTYVITAATGRTGSHITRALLKAGHLVRALGRDADRLKPLVELGAEGFVGELSDELFMRRSFDGADAAYLVVPGGHDARDFRREFADTGSVYAQAAEATSLPAAVFLSTIGAHDDRYRGFILTHGDVEHILNKLKGVNILHLRAPKFFENLFYFLPASQAADALVTPLDPDAQFDMAHSKDIGEAALQRLLALDFEGNTSVELHGREVLTMRIIAERLSQIAGCNIAVRKALRQDDIEAMVMAGMQRDFSTLINDTWDTFSRFGLLRAPTAQASIRATSSIDDFLRADFLPAFNHREAA
jgi:uncharacterized protein YbjT (DUF2867 family)